MGLEGLSKVVTELRPGSMMSVLRGQQGRGATVPAEESKALVLRIFDLFIGGENPETAGG